MEITLVLNDVLGQSLNRGEGYIDAVMKAGRVVKAEGQPDGLQIDADVYKELQFQYGKKTEYAEEATFTDSTGVSRRGWVLTASPQELNAKIANSMRVAFASTPFSVAQMLVEINKSKTIRIPRGNAFGVLKKAWEEVVPSRIISSTEQWIEWVNETEKHIDRVLAGDEMLEDRKIGNEIRRQQGPSITQMAANFAGAMGAYAMDGFRHASKEQHAERLAICNACEFWDAKARLGAGKCLKCGCAGAKLWIASSECPIKKWGRVEPAVPATLPLPKA